MSIFYIILSSTNQTLAALTCQPQQPWPNSSPLALALQGPAPPPAARRAQQGPRAFWVGRWQWLGKTDQKTSNFDENGWTCSKDWRKPRKISIELKTIEVGPLCLEVCFRSGQLLWPYVYVVPWSSMTLLRWHVKKLASKHIKTTLLICLLDSIPISTLQNPSCLIVTQNVDNYSQFQGNSKHRIG